MNFFLISRHLTGKPFSGKRYLTFKIEIELQLLGCLYGKSTLSTGDFKTV